MQKGPYCVQHPLVTTITITLKHQTWPTMMIYTACSKPESPMLNGYKQSFQKWPPWFCLPKVDRVLSLVHKPRWSRASVLKAGGMSVESQTVTIHLGSCKHTSSVPWFLPRVDNVEMSSGFPNQGLQNNMEDIVFDFKKVRNPSDDARLLILPLSLSVTAHSGRIGVIWCCPLCFSVGPSLDLLCLLLRQSKIIIIIRYSLL